MSNTNPDGKMTGSFRFAAIDQYVETYIVSPKETNLQGKDMVQWGDGDAYTPSGSRCGASHWIMNSTGDSASRSSVTSPGGLPRFITWI